MPMLMSAPRAEAELPHGRARRATVRRCVLWLLGSRLRRLLGPLLIGLRYTARSGAVVTLPVRAVADGDRLIIGVGHADDKRWWWHFASAAPVEALIDGQWHRGTAAVDVDHGAVEAYRRTLPHARLSDGATMVSVSLEAERPSLPPLRGRALLRTWFTAVTAAEFVGFAVPATIGTLTASMNSGLAVPALLAAGTVEGAILGCGQATVLQYVLPGLARKKWVAATAGAATLAYMIGLIPSTLDVTTWPAPAVAVFAVVGGALLLVSIGAAQWLILRRHVGGAGNWTWETAVAWTVGLAVFLGFTMPLWRPGQAPWLIAVIGIAGGLLMAATTSLITGVALLRLLR